MVKNRLPLIFLLLFVSGFYFGIAVAVQDSPKIGTVIGIDLGTRYSCVGVYKDGHVQIIPDDQGNRIIPSWVAFNDTDCLIGEAAKNQASLNVERTIFNVKRLMGRKFDDPQVQNDMKLLPYKIVNKDGKPYIQVKGKDGEVKVFSPEKISAMILGKMKETAESYMGKKIKDAVITVPAHFNDAQRQATKDAGTIAGLNVVEIVDEPTAAAIAYGLYKKRGKNNSLVFDLGADTFDVSFVTIDDSGVSKVISTNGDTHLGGSDFDHRVLNNFIKLVKKRDLKDSSKIDEALGKLKKECERAKRSFSSQPQDSFEVKSLLDGNDFSKPLTRPRFEEFNMTLFKTTMGHVKKAMEDRGFKKADIHEIVLVGGSSQIPMVQQFLKDHFDGKEPHKGINLDEVVAYGAAVRGGTFSDISEEDFRGLLSFDVSPFSLGIETVGGVMTKIIPRKTILPTNKSQTFTTYHNQQTTVSVKVYEGDRSMAKDCFELGKFNLSSIEPAPSGMPQIEVTFVVDANGVLHVKAEDMATKKSKSITITKKMHSHEEMERQWKELTELAEVDNKAREEMREKMYARDQLETCFSNIKRTIKLSDKIDSDEKEKIANNLKEALKWLDDSQETENTKTDEFDEKMKELGVA